VWYGIVTQVDDTVASALAHFIIHTLRCLFTYACVLTQPLLDLP
jgi:hypothetical protein